MPLIVALAVGLLTWCVAHRLRLNERWKAPTGGSPGPDKWLLFLMVLQWLAVVHAFGDAVGSLSPQRLASAASSGPSRYAGYIASIAALVLLFIFVLWSSIMMHRTSRLFTNLFRIEDGAVPFGPVLIALWFTGRPGKNQLVSVCSGSVAICPGGRY